MKAFSPSKNGIALLSLKARRLFALADELSELAVAAKGLTDGEKAYWIESISDIQNAAVAADKFCRFSLNCPDKAGKDWELSNKEIAEARPDGFDPELKSFDFEN